MDTVQVSKVQKAQVSIEMLVLFGFMMMVLIAFVFVISSYIVDAQRSKERALLNDLGIEIKTEINLAASVSSGYRREIIVPSTAGGLDYEISLIDANVINGDHTELVLRLTGTSYDYSTVIFLPKNVYGSITKGRNIILKAYNGSIIIQQ